MGAPTSGKLHLESPYNNPFGRAGLLMKTPGAIVDNQLFKYEREKAACFFFGEVNWPVLASTVMSAAIHYRRSTSKQKKS